MSTGSTTTVSRATSKGTHALTLNVMIDRREKIFNVIKVGYVTKRKQNLPIYGIKSKDLREVTTTEKDMGKGVSRIPLQLARIYEEDVIEEMDCSPSVSTGSGVQKPPGMMEAVSALDNYRGVMEHRQ